MMRQCAWILLMLPMLACDRQMVAPPRDEPMPPAAAAVDASEPLVCEEPAVPRGCEINLGGSYHLRGKPELHYSLEDDGAHLVVRPQGRDAGETGAAMILDRGPRGFTGMVVGYAVTAGGKRCPISFQAEVVACAPGEVTVRSQDEAAIDERCAITSARVATEKVLQKD